MLALVPAYIRSSFALGRTCDESRPLAPRIASDRWHPNRTRN